MAQQNAHYSESNHRWVSTWVCAQQLTEPENLPPAPGLQGNTLRQLVLVSLGADKIRVGFSNVFGRRPVTIESAEVAILTGAGVIHDESRTPLQFGGASAVTIAAGERVNSDAIALRVGKDMRLSITTYMPQVPDEITGHPGSRTTSFMMLGNAVSARDHSSAVPVEHWYFLNNIDVWTDLASRAIVILADSITDGRGSTTNGNDRWPNHLFRRFQNNKKTANIALLNQGMGGNRLLHSGLGPSALSRFDRDVVEPPGVSALIVMEGINDIGMSTFAENNGESVVMASDVIEAYEQIVRRARAHGLRIYGGTLMPFEDSFYYTSQGEEKRLQINDFIRTRGVFDSVIDFDAIVRDPSHPHRLLPAVDGGDHLHPSVEGHRIIAEGIDLSLFEA